LPNIAKGPVFKQSEGFSKYIDKVAQLKDLKKNRRIDPEMFTSKLAVLNTDW
jgi:hypothetical protein